jgi:hypothetical protein
MRIRTKSAAVLLGLVVAVALGACSSRGRGPRRDATSPASSGGPAGSTSDLTGPGDWSLNRGDWLRSEQGRIWRVMEQQRQGGSLPIGFVTERRYQEMRGGPIFTMYEVWGPDRTVQKGQVDALGNAVRFDPIRNRGVDSTKVGNASLELSVGAIFGTVRPLTLEPTSEHALAFEALDVNRDGRLDKSEFPRVLDKFHNPDTNKDGFVDPGEFDAADSL